MVPVNLGAITVPEDHRRRWATVNHVARKLQGVRETNLLACARVRLVHPCVISCDSSVISYAVRPMTLHLISLTLFCAVRAMVRACACGRGWVS
jgi:tRNA(Phe) wybutosine-synthesizing methylase Tyw3